LIITASKKIFVGSLGAHGTWSEKLIFIDDIGAMILGSYGIYMWTPQIRGRFNCIEYITVYE